MSAPPAMARLTVAMLPSRRSVVGKPSTRPMTLLREVPARMGRPSARSSPEPAQQLEILPPVLAEAEAGIDDDVVPGHARRQRAVDPPRKLAQHARHQVDPGFRRHVVHQHRRHACRGDDRRHLRVGHEAAHVVHQIGAGRSAAAATSALLVSTEISASTRGRMASRTGIRRASSSAALIG